MRKKTFRAAIMLKCHPGRKKIALSISVSVKPAIFFPVSHNIFYLMFMGCLSEHLLRANVLDYGIHTKKIRMDRKQSLSG